MHRFGGIYESNLSYSTTITTATFHSPPPPISMLFYHVICTPFFTRTNQEKKIIPILNTFED